MDACLCLCNTIKSAANSLDKQLNASLEGLDISHCQAMLVVMLGDGKRTVSDMSKALCCSCGNISQMVDLLVEKDVVERLQSTEDRRRAELTLTVKGKKLCETAKHALNSRASHCCSVFSPQEKHQLQTLLEKYIAAVGVKE